MTQTTSTPDMPPPADATFIGDWDACGAGTSYRFITFAERTVTDHPARVSLHAFQWANGSLAGSGEEAPGIAILDASIQPLNSDQARWPPPPSSTLFDLRKRPNRPSAHLNMTSARPVLSSGRADGAVRLSARKG